jgi:hypothetical protein
VRRAVIASFVLSSLIELAQFLMIPGRNSTIGDVLTNSIGGAIGFAIGRYGFALLRPSPRIASTLSMGWSAVWLAIQTISAFGFSPDIPRSQYYGQIARQLGNFEQFRGRVLRASIADIVVPDTQFNDGPRVRELLLRGATVTTTIVPPGSARGIAPILRVADASQREIVLLAQNASGLIFGVRTGAATLRLRPPLFALKGVFPTELPGESGLSTDTITVSARYSARELWARTQWTTSYDRRIPVTASLGWTMLMPFQWFIEGTRVEFVVNTIWLACLLFPIGYWGVVVARVNDPSRFRMSAVPIALLVLSVGLVAVPHAFGMNAAPPSDWLAALTGILMGGAVSLRRLNVEENTQHTLIAPESGLA